MKYLKGKLEPFFKVLITRFEKVQAIFTELLFCYATPACCCLAWSHRQLYQLGHQDLSDLVAHFGEYLVWTAFEFEKLRGSRTWRNLVTPLSYPTKLERLEPCEANVN